jgi:YVTN family beta-propeller protein
MRTCRRAALLLAALTGLSLRAAGPGPEHVGRLPDGGLVTPVGQWVRPIGRQVDLAGTRPLTLALSPDGKTLATAGKSSALLLIDPAQGTLRQRVALPSDKQHEPPAAASSNILRPDANGQQSFTGLVWSRDGRRIYLSNVDGDVKVFEVAADGTAAPSFSIPLPPAGAPRRRQEIPAGLALSADGARLYVCGNLSNRLFELDAADGKLRRSFDVGCLPYDVLLAGGKAYVSNWGGRRPAASDLVGPAGRGTTVKIDPVHNVACEGSVTVIDLEGGAPPVEIVTGTHASALALSPDGRWLVCANATADNLSVIDRTTNQVAETIWAKANPADLFGAQPNALCFDPSGRRLYCANATHNAVAVIDFAPPGGSKLLGLIPVGWFPDALAFDAGRGQLCVANLKSLPAAPRGKGYNSHQYTGSLSLLPVPREAELPGLSEAVYRNLRRERIAAAAQPPRPDQPPRPVPERLGEPSVFKHVVYVIKENRTYDQILGDVKEGNGDAEVCMFGERVTPNQHKMVHDYVLLDNTSCCSILSADGHQWSTTAIGTDYLEREFAGWPRSYPDGMGEDECDAMVYSPAGFIWDDALAHHVSVYNFGEFTRPDCGWADRAKHGGPSWSDYWNDFQQPGGAVRYGCIPTVDTLKPFSPTAYVGWNLSVPDVWRARYIKQQIAAWEAKGEMPGLTLICLPDDHTSGTSRSVPTPAAQVADNDLAFGQIVEALTHSKFGRETLILGIEDDPQAGLDHVSGYRTTAYCVSAYTKRHTVVSTMYNTVSLLRTIEQVLGLPPMNQFDAAAEPMADCFTDQPDFTAFDAVPNQQPLDQLNGAPAAQRTAQLRRDAEVSERLNFREADRCPEAVLNGILWRATMGPETPVPSWAAARSALIEDKRDDDD